MADDRPQFSSSLLDPDFDPSGICVAEPNLPGGAGGLGSNFAYNTPTRESNDRYSGRLDYQLTFKDRSTGRYYYAGDGPYQSGVGGATDKCRKWAAFAGAAKR
jgi:hypothetical protein